MEKIDISIWNFLPNNLLRFVILQKNWHTVIGYPGSCSVGFSTLYASTVPGL